MLHSEHAIVTFDQGRAHPDRLTRQRHAHYLDHAAKMLGVYRSGIGQTRRELHLSIQNLLAGEEDCDPRRVAAFCKLLDDVSEFDQDRRGRAAELRLKVFALAARQHPLVASPEGIFESEERQVKERLAAELGRPWQQIDDELYADVPEFQRLRVFQGYADAQSLLSRYNVAQAQACLYRAERLTIHAHADFKTILRYAKLAGLVHEIRRLSASHYRIDLSGASSVLRRTRRYGADLARFLPALLACQSWTMDAQLRTPWGSLARLHLSSHDGLRSHLPAPQEFDSSVEEAFARKWGLEQEGWRLTREDVILHEGQDVFFPDFVFRRAGPDGGCAAEAHLEIVGFWTPQYLEKKRQTLRRFHHHRLLIAVPRQSLREGASIPPNVVVYKTVLKVQPVLEALRALPTEPPE